MSELSIIIAISLIYIHDCPPELMSRLLSLSLSMVQTRCRLGEYNVIFYARILHNNYLGRKTLQICFDMKYISDADGSFSWPITVNGHYRLSLEKKDWENKILETEISNCSSKMLEVTMEKIVDCEVDVIVQSNSDCDSAYSNEAITR